MGARGRRRRASRSGDDHQQLCPEGRRAPAERPRCCSGTIAFESGQGSSRPRFKFLALCRDRRRRYPGQEDLAKTPVGPFGKPATPSVLLVRISAVQQAGCRDTACFGDTNGPALGDLPAAERYYRDALQNHNGGRRSLCRPGMTQFQSGRRDQAPGHTRRWSTIQKSAASADTTLLLGLLYYSEDRSSGAFGGSPSAWSMKPEEL